MSLFAPLVVGASVVVASGADIGQVVDYLDAFKPTYFSASPTVLAAILETLRRRGVTPPNSLRFVRSVGNSLPALVQSQLEDALGVPVIASYSMTETGRIAQDPLPPGQRRANSVGLPLTQVAIIGDEGKHLPAREIGEIVVKGPGVMNSYEGNSEPNEQAFHGDWFRTGDLGYFDDDGYLFLSGRIKELINRGGFKVSPSAVDAAVMQHPEVVDAATFGVPHSTLGEDVVTAAVLREPARVTMRELRDFVFEHLPAFMVPSQMVLVSELPRTSVGKLKRTELAAMLKHRLRVAFSPPRDSNEELIAGFFAEVLGIDGVGAFDNFFELGGDSLRGAQVVVRANSALGSNLQVADLFKRPTVAEFSAELTTNAATSGKSALPLIEPQRRSLYRHDAAEAKARN